MPLIRTLQQDLHTLLEKEDVHWRQRAKADWVKLGDRNTKFFHASANQRCRNDFIHKITDEEGQTLEEPEAIALERQITLAMNKELLKEFTMDEVSQALNQMAP
ncbi:uncharacterized protein LOC132191284 [Corylus avellana]|uniref:uncharacterized protein LOC132191284 n=1 Tax=Corylus avellana TaxID=13451 RepID=UPI00286CB1A1|nr:uncharacterized protein LOC132191284 [Corylus avellana]